MLLSEVLSGHSRFSKSEKGNWHIVNNSKNLALIFQLFRGKAWIDTSKLYEQKTMPKIAKRQVVPKAKLSAEAQQFLSQFEKFLQGKRYSTSTVGVYALFVTEFVRYVTVYKPFRDVTNKDFHLFCEDVLYAKSYSISSQRQFVSALKQLLLFAPKLVLTVDTLYTPMKDKKLPTVLSSAEVIDLIRSCKNLKHRTALAMLYSSGLRVGELLSLKLYDINFDRRQVTVEQGKGRKDRVVVMAESIIPLAQNYLDAYSPKVYFMEGSEGKQYSASSIRKFLKSACKAVGITKPVTPHTLRHSYATHMLENGVDLRYIQELLGHARPETTMIYTHVARKDLLAIKSPLDVAVQKLRSDKQEQNFRLSRNYKAK